MKIVYAILLLFLAESVPAFSQDIKWSAGNLLTWDDFRGTVEPNSGVSAMVGCGIKFSYRYFAPLSDTDSTYTARFDVYSCVDPEKSWSMKERQCIELLNHEQRHFDICEYLARQLRVAFESAHYTKNIKNEIADIFSRYDSERDRLGKIYDARTNHGADVKKQAQWNVFIDKLLSDNPPLEDVLKDKMISES